MIGRIKQDLTQFGYYYCNDFAEADLLRISQCLGIPTADGRGNPVVKILKPERPSDPRRNTLSSKYGTDAFPFHTETAYWPNPACFVVLYCVYPGSGHRPTYLVDSYAWELTREEKRTLCNEVWKVFTGIDPFLCTIGKTIGDGMMLRFDNDCMKPALSSCCQARGVVIRGLQPEKHITIHWYPRDLLIIDNYRMLHGRGTSAVEDSERCLKRILIARCEDY